jgi:hypothetical protein
VNGRREAAIALSAYAAYLAVRGIVWTDRGRARALRNGQTIIAVERRLGINAEPSVQSMAVRAPRVVDVLNASYAAGNIALSVGWLYWLYRCGDDDYHRERRATVIAFTGALPFFLAFPTAPPRKQAGFVDTLAARGIDIEHPLLVRFYNPIAAMPSHHMAFAVVTGAGLVARADGVVGRTVYGAYAPLIAFVVVATGNHYLFDVVAGAALGMLARRLAR